MAKSDLIGLEIFLFFNMFFFVVVVKTVKVNSGQKGSHPLTFQTYYAQ